MPPPRGAREDILLAAEDAGIVAAASDAVRRTGRSAPRAMSLADALSFLVGPGEAPHALLCETTPSAEIWPEFLDVASDPFGHTHVMLIGADESGRHGLRALSAEPETLADALSGLTRRRLPEPADDAEALRHGVARGEIGLRYQPIVRMRDGAFLGVEGLARWIRPEGPLGPDAFIPLAEREGLARELAMAVARRAATDVVAMRRRLPMNVSINLPLELVVDRATPQWLGAICAEARLPRGQMRLELTETTPVNDMAALRRGVTRLSEAGHPVMIDDMSLEEDRGALLDLPFAGLKLDRGLVTALPHSRRARAEVQWLVARAARKRMRVTAEGVSSASLWRAVAAAGVDNAQGYAVGRPLPLSALPAWAQAWRRLGSARTERRAARPFPLRLRPARG